METLAVVLMVLGLIGAGSALVVLVRLRGQLERLGEQVDRVARRVEALPPSSSRAIWLRDTTKAADSRVAIRSRLTGRSIDTSARRCAAELGYRVAQHVAGRGAGHVVIDSITEHLP